jgi:hypothetical protein
MVPRKGRRDASFNEKPTAIRVDGFQQTTGRRTALRAAPGHVPSWAPSSAKKGPAIHEKGADVAVFDAVIDGRAYSIVLMGDSLRARSVGIRREGLCFVG